MKFWDLEFSSYITSIKLMGGKGKLNTRSITKNRAGYWENSENRKKLRKKKAPEEVVPLFYSPDMWRTCHATRSVFFASFLKTAKVGMEKK